MRRLALAVGLLTFIIGLVFYPPSAQALIFTSARDCDDNAVIRCGALNSQELINRYQQPGVSQIFGAFGISSQDISNIRATAQAGKVTSDGQVFASGKLVAKDAITAGRQFMPGSTTMTRGGVTFYERPPSVSFTSSPLKAFVVMDGQQFRFAILVSCGNPVIATPITPKPVAKPQPAPVPTPTPTPTTTAPTQTQTQVQSQTVVVNTPTVKTTAKATPRPAPAKGQSVLPNTGPSEVLMLFGGVTALGSLGHWFYYRRPF